MHFYSVLYPHKHSFRDVYRNHPVHLYVPLSVQMSCKHNSSLTDESMLMNLNTVAKYDLRICMKEDYPGPNYFKGDN